MDRLTGALDSVVGKARDIIRGRRASAAGTDDASRNYDDEREATRRGDMSEEDRAWEAASQERSKAAEAGDGPPPERD